MDSLRNALTQIKAWLDWLPTPAVALAIVAIACVIALIVHNVVHRLLRRLIAERRPYLLSVLTRLQGLTQLAILIVALFIAIPVAPFDPETRYWLTRIVLISLVTLIGWGMITTLNILAELYLRRFRLDTKDNLLARKHLTQVRVLLRTVDVLLIILTIGAALMTFEPVRQYGVSLFASAGVAGLVAGLAARPVLSNLFAGVQLAMTQPIRIDDAVMVENEFGTIEEITSTYVVVKLWDWRRMVVPLTYFIEKPFQNWTRESSAITGKVMLYLDYRAPIGALRARLDELVKASPLWDGRVCGLQVTDCKERVIEVRCLMSGATSGNASDLCATVREKLIEFLQRDHPDALPTQRVDLAVVSEPKVDAKTPPPFVEPRERQP